MKTFHYVYVTTNLINHKQYIGDHSTNNLNDSYIGSGRPYFQNAIKKYGKQNFLKQILEQFDTREKAFKAQEKYIKEYNTLYPNGYNLSPTGGLRVKGCHSIRTRKNISKNNKGKTRNKGMIVSEETKNKIRNKLTGIKHSEERKQHMRKSHKKMSKEILEKRKFIVVSEKTRQKRSKSLQGLKRSEETKQRIKASWILRKQNS